LDLINHLNKDMNFFKRIFKPHLKTLAKNTVELLPLSEVGKDEDVRLKVLEYLKNKYPKDQASDIISHSEYAVEKQLGAGSFFITLRKKGERNFFLFLMMDDNGDIEEMKPINPGSGEGKKMASME
jgi:hypothetical protein